MRSSLRLAVACVVTALGLALAAGAVADPGDDGHADEIGAPPPVNPLTPPGSSNMQFLDAVDNDGTINSDLAFYGNLAFVGSYDRFRIVDISNPSNLRVLSSTNCRANQGDLSVFKANDGRLFMLQSIDRAVTAPDCTATDTATTTENEEGHTVTRNRFGYEGLRLFNVTDPANPQFVAFYRTACGSHTHTLVPDGDEVHAYIASYPLGSQITPKIDRRQADALGLACEAPHSKISIVDIPLANPANGEVREKALSSDTEFYDGDGPKGHAPPFQACHDHQAFLPKDIMVASCAGDLQYWDISDRGNPTSADGEPHTHIQREVREDDPSTPDVNERWESFDFMHNATVSWDGEVVAAVDESGGGVESRCDGDDTKRGFTWFYPLVDPGTAVNGFEEMGRYIIPRPQGTEVCVSHNGNVLPTTDGSRQQVQAFYQGGNTWFDFTDPLNPHEIGFADLEKKQLGAADSWSSYWYNDVLWVNGGLNRRGGSGNRGFEAYALIQPGGNRLDLANWDHLNPQTQEAWQTP